jgi:hypothetical protein
VASQLDIYNLALSNLDSSQTVQSINDNSEAAGACNRFYDWARQKVLEGAHWDFATKTPALALMLDQVNLPISSIIYPGYRFVYQRPQDCLRFLAVTTNYGLRVNPFLAYWWRAGAMDCSAGSWGPFRPPFVQRIDQISNPVNQGIVILTDQDSAWGVYVTDVTNVNLWTNTFKECVAWNLASKIAGPISANQRAKENAIKMAAVTLTEAYALSVSQSQPDPYPDSPAITARN